MSDLYYSYPVGTKPPSQNLFVKLWRGFITVLRYGFLAFHYTAVTLSWAYILIPVLGWRKSTRIGLAYIGLTMLIIAITAGIISLITGNYAP